VKILIVEDNDQDRKLMLRFLSKAGYTELSFAAAGWEGIECAVRTQPGIVIIDTILPDMQGFEVCRAVKQSCAASAKIIVMTGCIDAVDAGKARKAGADDYVVKTSDFFPLIEAVRAMVQEKETI